MKKEEIKKKFDEIVSFSEVERFIDTPVKHYSSGMYLRLAFAVAAHLEPDILLVDEVLAVGDISFQKKCLGKMGSVAKEGRTVLFISHNMGAITALCSRALWLDGGRLLLDGSATEVVSRYISSGIQDKISWTRDPTKDSSGQRAWLKRAQILSAKEVGALTVFHHDEKVRIKIEYEIKSPVKLFRSYAFLRDSSGNILWASHDTDGSGMVGEVRDAGVYSSTCVFPDRILRPGHYHVSIGIYGQPRELVEEEHLDVMSFEVSDAGYTFARDPRMGLMTPCLEWEVVRHEE
jgi:lipopolysaccharide transport system ATP-binding protein